MKSCQKVGFEADWPADWSAERVSALRQPRPASVVLAGLYSQPTQPL
jgi:hypothetical protein